MFHILFNSNPDRLAGRRPGLWPLGADRPDLRLRFAIGFLLPLLILVAQLAWTAPAAAQDPVPGNESGPLARTALRGLKERDGRQPAGSQPDLVVDGICIVKPGTY